MPEPEKNPNEPYATIDREGVRVHIPIENGEELSFVLNAENALALVASLTARAQELKTTPGKVRAGVKLLSWLLTK